MEQFVDIKGYENKYQVSNLGNVRSLRNNRILHPISHTKGYLKIELWKDGKRKSCYIHRLVAEAFLENPDGKSEVNHINAIRSDNRAENLEWVSTSENAYHRWHHAEVG